MLNSRLLFYGFGLTDGPIALPMWTAFGVAICLVGIGAIAYHLSAQKGPAGVSWRVVLAAVGGLLIWLAISPSSLPKQSTLQVQLTARGALESRAAEIRARALARHPTFACLDTISNATIETACEKALFASADTIMAAVDYTQARLLLLADSVEVAKQDPSYEPTVKWLRRAIEADRFGLVAQVLTIRGCHAGCDALKLLRDPQHVLDNLNARTFDSNVALHAASWGAPVGAASTDDSTVAPAAPAPASLASRFSAIGSEPPTPKISKTGSAPSKVRYEFPSAASIPAINIMDDEPTTPEHAAPTPTPERRTTAREQQRQAPQRIAPTAPGEPPTAAAGGNTVGR
jgi:hypothetical protein